MFKRAYVEITNRCNLRCAFCPGTRRPLRDMTAEEFSRITDRLRPAAEYLYFHVMGEPLCHPELEKLLAMAAEKGFRSCLTTNGTLLPRRAQPLLQAEGLHRLSVSLHSFEGNEGARQQMEAYLQGVWDVCRPLAERGVICVLRLWNEGGLEARNQEIIAFLERCTGQRGDQWPAPRKNAKRLAPGLFLEHAARFGWPDLTAPERGTEFCLGLRDQIAVLSDGTVVPCCLDHEGDLALGNLLEQELEEILASPRARALYDGFSRRRPAEELCSRCGYAARFSAGK